jgi:Putative transposase DNA-binding domain
MRLTRAVTHVRLCAANDAKLAALDELAAEFMALCQQYVVAFCSEVEPNAFLDPCFPSPLSQRWQRVAIQQAAGVARSWRSNYERAQDDFADILAARYDEDHFAHENPNEVLPTWQPWRPPTLRKTVIRANANVAVLETSQNTDFDYWLRVSTLEARHPILLPVALSTYHRRLLSGKMLDSSTTLTRTPDGWWLTLSYDDDVPIQTPVDAPVVGVDVGITHFITTSTGKHYGSFQGKLAQRHQRDREKRQRKAKLRACLEKKGVDRLPSTHNPKLARTVRQEINRAVNEMYRDHPNSQVAYESLSVATMRFKARRMNALLYASNLAHLPKQLAWGALKHGIRATKVPSAYTSQACQRCHYVAWSNRPDQQTFCCGVCGFQAHADKNAAVNIARRVGDQEVQACRSRQELRALLDARHQRWRQETGWS